MSIKDFSYRNPGIAQMRSFLFLRGQGGSVCHDIADYGRAHGKVMRTVRVCRHAQSLRLCATSLAVSARLQGACIAIAADMFGRSQYGWMDFSESFPTRIGIQFGLATTGSVSVLVL